MRKDTVKLRMDSVMYAIVKGPLSELDWEINSDGWEYKNEFSSLFALVDLVAPVEPRLLELPKENGI